MPKLTQTLSALMDQQEEDRKAKIAAADARKERRMRKYEEPDSEWLRNIILPSAADKKRLLKIADKLAESEPPPPPKRLAREEIIACRDIGRDDGPQGTTVIAQTAMDHLCNGALRLLEQVEALETEPNEQTIAQKLKLEDGKYTHWMAELSDDQMHGLLWLVGEFVARASAHDFKEALEKENYPGTRRKLAAMSAIAEFGKSPMGLEETLAYIREARRRR